MANIASILLFLIVVSSGTDVSNGTQNGEKVTIEKYPYVVSVRYNDKHICGGAILDKRTVITSAQCIFDMKPKPKLISIRVGSEEHATGMLIKGSGKAPKHPSDYKREVHENDIGIIKLASDLEWSEKVRPVQLPEESYIPPDDAAASFVGWGVNGDNEEIVSGTLRQTSPTILSYMKCTEKYGMNMIHPDTMLCAASRSQEFCRGDLGGPLVIDNTLVGVASWIYNCKESTYPGVYTSVARFREFIDKNLENPL